MEKWKSKSKLHGVTSILMVYAALVIGAVAVFRHSVAFGIIDIALAVMWPFPVAWFYCAKCCCRQDCGHVIIGVVTRIFPERKPGKYAFGDALGTIVPILTVVAFPQYWLWGNTAAFIAFWVLVALAGIQVRLGVCTACPNTRCPLNKG